MPEDRFGDLEPAGRRERGTSSGDDPGGATERRPEADRSAAERLSDLDAMPEAERDESNTPPPGRSGSRYAWVLGVVGFLVLALAAVTTLRDQPGTDPPSPGRTLPDFAAPSALSGSEADANIRQRGGPEEQAAVPACEVAGEDVVNICELRDRPVVLTFVAPGCEEALDRVDAIRAGFPGVSFVGVIIGESPEGADDLLAEHEWGFPVALDPDSAIAALYRAVDCPTTVTAEAGGEVVETRNGFLTEEELRAAVEEVAVARGGPA